MKQIAILHTTVPPIIGGIESTIYHHVRLLNQAGYFVRVIAGSGDESYYEASFHHQVEFQAVPEINPKHPDVQAAIQSLSDGRGGGALDELSRQIAGQLEPVLADSEVCIVHNAMTHDGNLALTAALRQLVGKSSTHFFAWCHDFASPDSPRSTRPYPWELLYQPWPGVHYVAVSSYRREQLARLMGLSEEQIGVVPPGIEIPVSLKWDQITTRLVEELDLLGADPLMLLAGRLERDKNIEFAIRVTAALKQYKPRPALLVTSAPHPQRGSPANYIDFLEALRDEFGLRENVYFLYRLGEYELPFHIPESVLSDLYQFADLFLFPSTQAGFGQALLGAGLARQPIFASDIPALQESTGGLAHLFDPHGDPQAIAGEIIAYLETDRAYQMRRRVLDQFEWQKVFTNHLIPLIEAA